MNNSQFLKLTHGELFVLPEIQPTNSAQLTYPSYPEQKVVTGDREVDAVLWLHSVIRTGQSAFIDKAMEAARFIKTPLADLEKRYRDHLMVHSGGNPFSAFASFGFSDLESMAEGARKKESLRVEAYSRFGESLSEDTPAEIFCIEALREISPGDIGLYDDDESSKCFHAYKNLLPKTLTECITELHYWNKLYSLRNSCIQYYDSLPESFARECFVFALMAKIPPESREEARAAHQCVIDLQKTDQDEYESIVWNLIS